MNPTTASAVSVPGLDDATGSRGLFSGRGFLAWGAALVVALLALAVVTPSQAHAAGAARYVAKTGSDSTGSGTLASPWATIQKAANTMAPGDTVHIGAGTYAERVTVSSAKSGSASAHTAFVADGDVVVSKGFVLESSYTDLSGFEITPGVETGGDRVGQIDIGGDHNTISNTYIHDLDYRSGISLRVGASYNTITDFRIREVPAYGITLSDTYNAGSDHTTVKNGTITQHRGWCAIELTGDNHLVEGVTISGPSGTGSPNHYDGDGIRVNYSHDSTIRNCVIHDLWEYYSDPQHTDCIQTWVGTYNLTIDSCVLGTWQPGPANRPNGSGGYLPQEIGPSQLIMCGTVPSAAHVDFTAKNCLFLGQCGTNASIVTARNSNSTIGINLYNNTFWSSYPSLNSVSSAVLRNNIFRSFYLYPANLSGIDSDYNAYCWTGGSGSNNVPAAEGAHSLGKTYATRVTPGFVNPDITATGGWGYGGTSDFSLAAGSPLVNAGVTGASIPAADMLGNARDAAPDLGAYEYGASGPAPQDTAPPAVSMTSPTDGATVTGSTTLAASAVDVGSGVARVEFRVDGVLLDTDTSAPFSATWDASAANAGTHTLSATAVDGSGNSAVSSVSVTVPTAQDTTAPSPVTGVSAARGGSGVTLAWTNPPADFAVVRLMRSVSGFSASAAASSGQTVVYEGSASSYADASAPTSALYYTIFARDAAGNWSAAATVQVAASATTPECASTTLALTASATRVRSGSSVTLRGRLSAAGAPVTTRYDVAVWKKSGGSWYRDGSATYDSASGTYRASRTLRKQTSYQLRFAGDAACEPQLTGCQSNVVTVYVSSAVSRTSLSKSSVSRGGKVTLSVTAFAAPAAKAKVRSYQLVGGSWKYRGTYSLRAVNSNSNALSYRVSVKAKRRGVWRFVGLVADDNGLASGPASRKLRVR
jgi:hypothetical protein